MNHTRSEIGTQPRGIVLVVVLVVIVMLSLAAYTFAELMLTEFRAGRSTCARHRPERCLIREWSTCAISWRSRPKWRSKTAAATTTPPILQGQLLVDGQVPRDRGRFTVISPNIENGELSGVRFGVQDESARLNLNALVAVEKAAAGAGGRC